MRTVGTTFVRPWDQVPVVQGVISSFGGDPFGSVPETERPRRHVEPCRPVVAVSPAAGDLLGDGAWKAPEVFKVVASDKGHRIYYTRS